MTGLDDIVGHGPAIDLLRRAVRSGRLPHALLFHGPDGVGKSTVARALACILFCPEIPDGACGSCASCTKLAHGVHPDLLIVRRLPKSVTEAGPMSDADADEGDLSPFIRVFQIRQLCEHAAYAPREAPCRVFLVESADRMNAESQNALLKTLEEPPGDSVLVLISARPHLLLSTVRSRCFTVGFGPLPAAEVAGFLESRGMEREEAWARAALSGGRPGRALGLDLEELRSRRGALVDMATGLAGSTEALARLPAASSTLAGRDAEDFLDQLELLEGVLRDAARLAAGLPEDSLLHADLASPLRRLADALGPVRAGELVRAAETLKADMRFNANRSLGADALVVALAGGPLP